MAKKDKKQPLFIPPGVMGDLIARGMYNKIPFNLGVRKDLEQPLAIEHPALDTDQVKRTVLGPKLSIQNVLDIPQSAFDEERRHQIELARRHWVQQHLLDGYVEQGLMSFTQGLQETTQYPEWPAYLESPLTGDIVASNVAKTAESTFNYDAFLACCAEIAQACGGIQLRASPYLLVKRYRKRPEWMQLRWLAFWPMRRIRAILVVRLRRSWVMLPENSYMAPSPHVYLLDGYAIMHPNTLEKFKSEIPAWKEKDPSTGFSNGKSDTAG